MVQSQYLSFVTSLLAQSRGISEHGFFGARRQLGRPAAAGEGASCLGSFARQRRSRPAVQPKAGRAGKNISWGCSPIELFDHDIREAFYTCPRCPGGAHEERPTPRPMPRKRPRGLENLHRQLEHLEAEASQDPAADENDTCDDDRNGSPSAEE